MARYKARADIFIGRDLIPRGAEFISADQPQQNWQPIDDDARRAVEERDLALAPAARPPRFHRPQY